mgnify:CR=1 FL=1
MKLIQMYITMTRESFELYVSSQEFTVLRYFLKNARHPTSA